MSRDIRIGGGGTVSGCRKPAWSSLPLSSRAAANRRSPATTGSPKAGYRGCSPATASRERPPSNPARGDHGPALGGCPPQRSTSSSACAPNSPAKDSTPAHTPSPGTFNTTTASPSQSAPSTATSPRPASSPRHRRNAPSLGLLQGQNPNHNCGFGLFRCPETSHGRGGGIRTHDLFVPNEARYQAAPHPA